MPVERCRTPTMGVARSGGVATPSHAHGWRGRAATPLRRSGVATPNAKKQPHTSDDAGGKARHPLLHVARARGTVGSQWRRVSVDTLKRQRV